MSMFRTWAQCLLWLILVGCLSAFVLTFVYMVYLQLVGRPLA